MPLPRPACAPLSATARLAPAALAAALMTACAPQPQGLMPVTPAPVPAPAPRPAMVPPPTARPHTTARPAARRAADEATPAPAPPSAASQTMTQYLQGIQDTLLARGLLRTDGGGPARPSAATLAKNFVQIALRDEYQMTAGRLVPDAHPAPLRRWDQPVRLSVEFGDSVPDATRSRDRAVIGDFAARLSRVTGHPVALGGDGGNFVVLIVNEDERRAIGPRVARLIPGIPQSDLHAIENLSPQNYCTVFAYSPGAGRAYSNAVAVIRAELPEPLRTSCVHEELAQGMGLANDSPDARPSIFNDDEEFAFLTTQDELLLKMLYDPRLRPGMTETEARPIIDRIAAELAR